jgi:hypothetical protein
MDKTLIFGPFMKLLGYRLSRLSTNTLNFLIKNLLKKKNGIKKKKNLQPAEKMRLSGVYYSKFGCCGFELGMKVQFANF